jgi:hypothetical protein
VEISIGLGSDRKPVGFVVKYKIGNYEFNRNFTNEIMNYEQEIVKNSGLF